MTSQIKIKTVISLQDVTFSYTDKPVLEQVTFAINKNEMIGVIGPNGSGKTTLLRLILGLLEPDSGTIRVFDKSPQQASSLLGYVPQHMQFDDRFPVSVLDVALMGMAGKTHFGLFSKKMTHAAESALETVELADFRHRNFADLSGGQRQRVLIARALSTAPKMLLFDEPTANVDSSAGEKIFCLLDRLKKDMTILVVSHDVGFINHHISRVVCVNRQVHVHPTSELDGQNITDLYGNDMALIHHHQNLTGAHKSCSNS